MTSFMPSNTPALDPYVTTAQWSRRFLGLRLFLALAATGWEGYAKHVEQAVALGWSLAETMSSYGWTVVNKPDLAVVCITPPAGSAPVREIVRRIVASGGAWVSAAAFAGRDVVRACITHGETSHDDIMHVVRLLNTCAKA
jgi:glutamate/tyrosine decarboxylase-like PLP-dependent enzyme